MGWCQADIQRRTLSTSGYTSRYHDDGRPGSLDTGRFRGHRDCIPAWQHTSTLRCHIHWTHGRLKRLILKVWTFIYSHLQGNQNSSVLQFDAAYWVLLTSTSSRRRGAISGSPLPKWTDFGPAIDWHMILAALWPSPEMFNGNDSLVLVTILGVSQKHSCLHSTEGDALAH